jgi:hypothetical protein
MLEGGTIPVNSRATQLMNSMEENVITRRLWGREKKIHDRTVWKRYANDMTVSRLPTK